jgi:hypothetical protein
VPRPSVPDSAGDFHGVEVPPVGQARIYLFRPAFSFTALRRETPTCIVDGAQTSELAHGTYTSLSLTPGRHVLSLTPKESESPLWRSESEFNVDADSVYFVAVWVELDVTEGQRMLWTSVPYAGRMFFLPIPVPSGPNPPITVKAGRVRLEVVSEADATRALYGARYITPSSTRVTNK